MSIIKNIVIILLLVISFFVGYFYRGMPKKEYIYELKKPLKVATNNESGNYFLPPGTLLYLDWQPGEGGFDLYRVYINVFGPPLKVILTEKRGLIAPITAYIEEDNK